MKLHISVPIFNGVGTNGIESVVVIGLVDLSENISTGSTTISEPSRKQHNFSGASSIIITDSDRSKGSNEVSAQPPSEMTVELLLPIACNIIVIKLK